MGVSGDRNWLVQFAQACYDRGWEDFRQAQEAAVKDASSRLEAAYDKMHPRVGGCHGQQ